MLVADVVAILIKDAILIVSDGPQWHPVCMKACSLCIGAGFKIHLEPNPIRGNAYEYHKYDKCVVQVHGQEVPLKEIFYLLNLPLPDIEDGRFNCEKLQKAIIARRDLHLQEIEVVSLTQ